jgi:hypothetical protein
MVSGIYSAQFISNSNHFGTGIVVIDGASLHGGDAAYLYRSKYSLTDNRISAAVEVENYSGSPMSVFGPLSYYRLTLNGVIEPHGFILSGAPDGMPNHMVRIELKKIGELIDQ